MLVQLFKIGKTHKKLFGRAYKDKESANFSTFFQQKTDEAFKAVFKEKFALYYD